MPTRPGRIRCRNGAGRERSSAEYMYPLTIGLAIENRDLWEQAQAWLVRPAIPHHCGTPGHRRREQFSGPPGAHAAGRRAGRYQHVGRNRSKAWWPHIRGAIGDPMIIALNNYGGRGRDSGVDARGHQRISVSAAAGDPAQARSKSARWSAAGGATAAPRAAGKAFGFISAKGGCGATTLVCHVAAELGRQNQKVLLADLDLDAGMVAFITKTKAVYSILDAVNNLHRLDISLLEGAGLQRHSGSGDRLRAARAGFQAAAQGRSGAACARLRAAALRLDAGRSRAAA